MANVKVTTTTTATIELTEEELCGLATLLYRGTHMTTLDSLKLQNLQNAIWKYSKSTDFNSIAIMTKVAKL